MARGRRKSLVGQRFGKLVVEKYEGTDSFRNSLWLCKCDCGNYTTEKGTLLTTGKIIGCKDCGRLATKPKKSKDTIDESIIGKRYGKLVVQKVFYDKDKNGKVGLYAKCKCDCGNSKNVLVTYLKRGSVASCGCLRKENRSRYRLSDDFIGQRFGKLVVVEYDNDKHKWKCQCDCGNITYLAKGSLTNVGIKSCGCGRYKKNRG